MSCSVRLYGTLVLEIEASSRADAQMKVLEMFDASRMADCLGGKVVYADDLDVNICGFVVERNGIPSASMRVDSRYIATINGILALGIDVPSDIAIETANNLFAAEESCLTGVRCRDDIGEAVIKRFVPDPKSAAVVS